MLFAAALCLAAPASAAPATAPGVAQDTSPCASTPGAAPAVTASASGQRPYETYQEYLYGLPPGLDLRALVGKTEIVGSFHYLSDYPSGKRLGGYAEVVAVYDIPLRDLVEVATDFDMYTAFMPRMLDATVLSRDGPLVRTKYRVGLSFMGIELAYDTVCDTLLERLPEGAMATRSWLVESPDGNTYESFNSFYFHPVNVGGRTMTFVRFFTRPGINRPSSGTLQLAQMLASSEARSQVSAIAKEALRRAKKR